MEMLAAAFGVADAAFSIFGALGQKKNDKRQVQLQFEDNREKIRRRQFEQEQTLGLTKTLAGASGVRNVQGSTPRQYMDVMSKEFEYELNWMREYTDRARRLGMKSASVNADTRVFNAIAGGIQGGTSIYSALNK